MFQSVTPINRNAQDSVVIATLKSGMHVQVGAPSTSEGAFALHQVLDFAQNGYYRDRYGKLRLAPGTQQVHTILGAQVAAYRVRQGSHEFGSIAQVPVNRIAGVKLAAK